MKSEHYETCRTFPGNQQITNLWDGSYTQNGANVTVKNESYNGTITPNASVNFGFNLSYSGSNTKPTGFNFKRCCLPSPIGLTNQASYSEAIPLIMG
ncbi:MAG TPA: cellulose binding domain-containing protein [Bacillota bacterium]